LALLHRGFTTTNWYIKGGPTIGV